VEEAAIEVNDMRIPASIESSQFQENCLSLRLCDIGRINDLERYLLARTHVPMFFDNAARALTESSDVL
jgi:hypothetical protein